MLLFLWREEVSPPRREVTTVHIPPMNEVSFVTFIRVLNKIVFAGEKDIHSGTSGQTGIYSCL